MQEWTLTEDEKTGVDIAGVDKGVKFCELECGPMPNVMAALSNIGGAL